RLLVRQERQERGARRLARPVRPGPHLGEVEVAVRSSSKGTSLTVPIQVAVGSDLPPPPLSRFAAWRRLRKNKSAATGMVIIAVMVLVAVFAPVLTALEGQDTTTQ